MKIKKEKLTEHYQVYHYLIISFDFFEKKSNKKEKSIPKKE
jgi:hypothetical protein